MYCFSPTHEYGQNTNVVKLLAKIDLKTHRPKQYTYYSSGIGTRPKPLHVSDRIVKAISDKFDMAVAWFVLSAIIYFFDGMKYLTVGIWRKTSRMRTTG